MKKGDRVRNRRSGSEGTVLMVNPPGMRGYALVEFTPGTDGLCIPLAWLDVLKD